MNSTNQPTSTSVEDNSTPSEAATAVKETQPNLNTKKASEKKVSKPTKKGKGKRPNLNTKKATEKKVSEPTTKGKGGGSVATEQQTLACKKPCRAFLRGNCSNEKCQFAHVEVEPTQTKNFNNNNNNNNKNLKKKSLEQFVRSNKPQAAGKVKEIARAFGWPCKNVSTVVPNEHSLSRFCTDSLTSEAFRKYSHEEPGNVVIMYPTETEKSFTDRINEETDRQITFSYFRSKLYPRDICSGYKLYDSEPSTRVFIRDCYHYTAQEFMDIPFISSCIMLSQNQNKCFVARFQVMDFREFGSYIRVHKRGSFTNIDKETKEATLVPYDFDFTEAIWHKEIDSNGEEQVIFYPSLLTEEYEPHPNKTAWLFSGPKYFTIETCAGRHSVLIKQRGVFDIKHEGVSQPLHYLFDVTVAPVVAYHSIPTNTLCLNKFVYRNKAVILAPAIQLFGSKGSSVNLTKHHASDNFNHMFDAKFDLAVPKTLPYVFQRQINMPEIRANTNVAVRAEIKPIVIEPAKFAMDAHVQQLRDKYMSEGVPEGLAEILAQSTEKMTVPDYLVWAFKCLKQLWAWTKDRCGKIKQFFLSLFTTPNDPLMAWESSEDETFSDTPFDMTSDWTLNVFRKIAVMLGVNGIRKKGLNMLNNFYWFKKLPTKMHQFFDDHPAAMVIADVLWNIVSNLAVAVVEEAFKKVGLFCTIIIVIVEIVSQIYQFFSGDVTAKAVILDAFYRHRKSVV